MVNDNFKIIKRSSFFEARNYYIFTLYLLLFHFFFTCFIGTSETVEYNVSTLIYGKTVLEYLGRSITILGIYLLFVLLFVNKKINSNFLTIISLLFSTWIIFAAVLAGDRLIINLIYIPYLLALVIAVSSLRKDNIGQLITYNINSFKLIGLSILILSVIIIINNPIPSFREIRTSVMHSNANEDALILVVSFPFLFLIRNKIIKVGVILYFLYFLIMYNSTRAAIIMSILSLIIIFYNRYKKYKLIYILVLIATLYFSTSFYKAKILDDPFFSSGIEAIENEESGHFSSRIYGIVIPIFEYTIKNSPIWGFGTSYYREMAENITYTEKGNTGLRSPHNFFIMFLFSWGIIGLLFCIIIYFRYFYFSFLLFKNNPTTLTSALFASWVSFTGMNFIANSFSYRGWTCFILLVTTTYFVKTAIKHNIKFLAI